MGAIDRPRPPPPLYEGNLIVSKASNTAVGLEDPDGASDCETAQRIVTQVVAFSLRARAFVGSEDKETSEWKREGARSHHMYVPQDSQDSGPPKEATVLINFKPLQPFYFLNYTQRGPQPIFDLAIFSSSGLFFWFSYTRKVGCYQTGPGLGITRLYLG